VDLVVVVVVVVVYTVGGLYVGLDVGRGVGGLYDDDNNYYYAIKICQVTTGQIDVISKIWSITSMLYQKFRVSNYLFYQIYNIERPF